MNKIPIVAILRGLQPERAKDVAAVLIEQGIRLIEVPLNSPNPLKSIETMVLHFGEQAIFGAGTVINSNDVQKISDVGGKLIVSPHCDPAIINACLVRDLIPIPGFFTATEAFTALHSGAKYLKFFPAQRDIYKAIKAVLPPSAAVIAVGGIQGNNLSIWNDVAGFGVGSAIFRPGDSLEEIAQKTKRFIQHWEKIQK